jgi:ankyrin repeat protein
MGKYMPTTYLKLNANKLMQFMNHSRRLADGEHGYNINNLGIRYGLAATAAQSNLIKDGLTSFRERLKYIATEGKEKNNNNNINTTDNNPTNHDLPAFFDTIAMYSGTNRYPEILGKDQYWLSLPQRLEKAKNIIRPVATNFQNSNKPSIKITGCYDKQNLKKYLTEIENTCNNLTPKLTPPNDTVSFSLTNDNHAIMLGYNASKRTWCIIDAKQLKYSLQDFNLSNKKHLDKLTKIILNAFDPTPQMLKNSKFNPFKKKTIGFTTEIHSNFNLISNLHQQIYGNKLLPQNFKSLNKAIYQLYLAILNDDLNSAKDLLKNKIISNNINKLNTEQLLFEAILNNNKDMVKLLLETPQIKDTIKHGSLLLTLAVRQNNFDILDLLLKNNIDPNTTPENSLALYAAVKQQNIEMIKLLLSHKANPNTVHNNESVLYHAVSEGNENIVNILLTQRADSNKGLTLLKPKPNEISPLYMAIRQNNIEIIKLLITHGADPNIACDLTTPLNYAIEKNNLELINILLKDAKADPNFRINNMEKPPLYVAVENFNIEAIKLLLEKGADIYAGYNTQSALALAYEKKQFYAGNYLEKAQQIINLLQPPTTSPPPLLFNNKTPPALPLADNSLHQRTRKKT